MKTVEYSPEFEVIENDEVVDVYMFLPGVTKENIHLEVTDENVLKVEAKRENNLDKKLIFGERIPQVINYYKALRLSPRLDSGNVKPSYHDGVLHISVAAKEKIPPKQIEIN